MFHSMQACATAINIISGAVAERTRLIAYVLYIPFVAGWVYPVAAHCASLVPLPACWCCSGPVPCCWLVAWDACSAMFCLLLHRMCIMHQLLDDLLCHILSCPRLPATS